VPQAFLFTLEYLFEVKPIATTSPSQKVGGRAFFRITHLARAFVPNRMDCLWLLASTLVLVGLLDPHIEQQILRHRWYSLLGIGKLWLALGFIASCMAGIAVTAGWKKLNPNSALILLVACVLSLMAFTWSLSDVTKTWGFGLDFYSQNRTPKNSILNNQSMVDFSVCQQLRTLVYFGTRPEVRSTNYVRSIGWSR
jgi:hypothetical protein